MKALVPVSGYLIVNLVANQRPLSPQAEHGWWYHYYFATQRGVDGYRENTHDFNKLIWQEDSPTWNFDDATYDRSAAAFTNPTTSTSSSVPTITIGSDFDGPNKNGTSGHNVPQEAPQQFADVVIAADGY